MRGLFPAFAAAAAFTGVPAAAEVTSSSAIHFDITSRIVVPADPGRAYQAMGEIASWWDGAHSYSGNAAGMRLELRAGGCFCEALPDGGTIEHLRVVQARPGVMLRLVGGLGPLQEEAVAGTFSLAFRAVPEGTEIVSRYLVSGHVRGDTGAYAAPVDAVLRAQFERLRAHLAR